MQQTERKVQPLPAPDRLDSWKEIAAYLSRSERTVRRWEAREELPVHRLQHDKRGSVYAYTRELDAWRASRKLADDLPETPSAKRGSLWWYAAGVVLVVTLGMAAGQRLWSGDSQNAERGTANDDAWRLFERARFGDNAGRVQIETGIRYYEQAIQLDPAFARAWAGLAVAQMALPFFSEQPPEHAMAAATRNAEQARRLDPSLGAPWRVLAAASHWLDWNHPLAETQFLRAIELQPDGPSFSWYGDFLTDLRRFDDARTQYVRAQAANGRWLEPAILAANVYTVTGQPELAIIEQRRILETEPNFGLGNHFLGRSYLASGDWPRAIEHLRKSNDLIGAVPFTIGDLGYALGASGQGDEAAQMRQELIGRREKGYYPAFPLALIELGLGNTDAALDWLERAVGERNTGFYLPSGDPLYDSLRTEPRFRALMARMNLPGS